MKILKPKIFIFLSRIKVIKAFNNLLRPELVLTISGSGELTVKEHDPGAVLRELLIKRVPDCSAAFELDHTPSGQLKAKLKNAFCQLSCLIHGSHPKANKSCDFVIVSPGVDKSRIVLADLKSRSPKKADCAAQLRNSELFLMYIISLISEYHGENIKPEFKKVVFFVVSATNAKAPAQQGNRQKPFEQDGVTYFPVVVRGRNNSKAIVTYPDFS